MNKACLLVTGTNPGAQIQVPVGLIYLGTQLQKHGYPVEISCVTDKKSFKICQEKIKTQDYLFVGFSVWMGPTSLDMIELSQIAKARGIPTIWGGKFVTSLKDEALTEKNVDIAVMGHAEETIVELADSLKTGSDLSLVKGIYYRNLKGEVIKTPDREFSETNLDKYDYDLSLINNWDSYVIKSKSGSRILDPFESQRGCLFRCRFCFHSDDKVYSSSNKKIVGFHSIEFIIEKARQLKLLTGVDKITFCDDEFWLDEKRSLELVERLKQIGIELFFIRIRFTSLNEYMLNRLQEFGVNSIACGLESGNARILKMMNKGLTLEKTVEKMELLAKFTIIVNTVIIIGNPTESKEEMLDSIRFTLNLRKIKKNLNILTFFYRPLPSTDFGKIAEEQGFRRPSTVREWVNVSAENIAQIGSQWLPWYNEREKKNMLRKDDYFILNSILCEQLYGDRPKRLTVKLFWPLFYLFERLTFIRMYKWNFTFPIESKILFPLYNLYKSLKRPFDV
jgi:radical SAM superfamily enzyme YgiQ (UPF0313 family)